MRRINTRAIDVFNNVRAGSQSRPPFRLELSAPHLVHDRRGQPNGVGVTVRMYDGTTEVPIDNHRIFVNPPLRRRDGTHDPRGALWEAVWDSIVLAPNPAGFGTQGTVTTIYSGANDGSVFSNSSVYATMQAGTGTIWADTSGLNIYVGQVLSGGFYLGHLGYVSFDTSSINDSDTVSVVTLSLWGGTDVSTTDFTLRARTYDWGNTVDTGDWKTGPTVNGYTLLASISTAAMAFGSYNALTSEAAFLTATNLKTGTVFIILSSSRYESETAPGGEERVLVSSADESGSTQDPKLTITHATAFSGTATATFPFMVAAAVGSLSGLSHSGTIVATFPFLTCAASGTVPEARRYGSEFVIRPGPRISLGG